MSDEDVIELSVRERVHRVLSGQSADYFIFPNAAAFAAEDLAPELVAEELGAMEAEGLLEREHFEVVVTPGHVLLAGLPVKKRLVHVLKGTKPADVTEPRIGGWRILEAHRIDLTK